MSDLVTWQELRKRLAADGVGEFGEAAIVDWLKAKPPIPVAKQPKRRGEARLFEYVDVLRWYAERKATEKKGYTPAGDADELDEPSIEYRKYKALRERLKYEAERGRLVDAETVRREYAKVFANARSRVLGVPTKLAAQVITMTTAEAERAIYDALADAMAATVDEYANESEEGAPTDSGSARDVSPTPEADSKPVGRRRAGAKPRGKRRAG